MKCYRIILKISIIILTLSFCCLSSLYAISPGDSGGGGRVEILEEAINLLIQGDELLNQRNYIGAIEKYNEAIQVVQTQQQAGDNFPEAYNNMGVANYRQARIYEAFSNFQMALNSYARFDEALINLGYIYYLMQEYQNAQNLAEKAIEYRNESDKGYGLLGLVKTKRYRWEEAAEAFDTAVNLSENNYHKAIYLINKANIWMERYTYEMREEEYDLSHQILYYNNAISILQEAEAILGDEADQYSRIVAFNGWLRHFFKQDLENANSYYRRALNLPSTPMFKSMLYYNIACVLAIRSVEAGSDNPDIFEVAKQSVLDNLETALDMGFATGPTGNNLNYIKNDPDFYVFSLKFPREFNALLNQYN